MKEPRTSSYSGLNLDRASALRSRPDQLNEKIEADGVKILPVSQGRGLVKGSETERVKPAFVKKEQAIALLAQVETSVFLGLSKRKAVFAALLSEEEENGFKDLFYPHEFQDVRHVSAYLKSSEAALLAYARGMDHWHKTHKFCSHCGSETRPENAGHVRKCQNPDCAREIFPRTDPAVIMLIESPAGASPKKCLLANHSRIQTKMFSTLAGFLEPGESLEEAVARETLEEVGIEVESIEYQGSQPWPFPGSVMIGFRAVAKTMDIAIDPDELQEARWFTREEVKNAEKEGGESGGLVLPPADSIARSLIRAWLKESA